MGVLFLWVNKFKLYIWENYHLVRCLPYHSPYKFRHGFAVYAIKHAKDMSDMKAISQNLMHSNISITDGIYGGLSDSDIKNQITNLLNQTTISNDNTLIELFQKTKDLLRMFENLRAFGQAIHLTFFGP